MRTIQKTKSSFIGLLTGIFLLVSNLVFAQTPIQPQGAGTAASPYLISNWQELYWVSQNATSWSKYFLQTADIDLTQATPAISTWNGGGGWTPIGSSTFSFSGIYEGGGYVINGLYCNRISSSFQGLFGYTLSTCKIENLGVTNVFIKGSSSIGSLIGYNLGSVNYCFVSGTVSGNNNSGGLVGYQTGTGVIKNCFSRTTVARVSGTNTNFGGFIGNISGGVVENCYSTGKIEYIGTNSPIDKGFVGYTNSSGNFSMSNNYWDITSSGQTSSYGTNTLGKTALEMKMPSTFIGWDFVNVWNINSGINGGYPYFQNTQSTIIEIPEIKLQKVLLSSNNMKVFGELVSLGNSSNPECGFLVNTNSEVSLSQYVSKIKLDNINQIGGLQAAISELEANTTYYVCAYATNEFGTYYSEKKQILTYSFDSEIPEGDGTEVSPFLISNWRELNWLRLSSSLWNMFYKQTADIDLQIIEPSIASWNNEGGWSPIGNNTMPFTGNYDGGGYVINGLYINRNTVSYQGLFGYTSSTSVISNLGVTNVDIYGSTEVGALVGRCYGTVSYCFSSGSVKGTNYIGGLIGLVFSTGIVKNCFSKVDVTDFGSSDIGGFVGGNSQSKISNCYSIGKINYYGYNPPTNKGFAGYAYNNGGFIMSDNYWDVNTSGQTTTYGDYAEGKTSEEMKTQSTFVGWDFIDIWKIDPKVNNGYPYLKNILSPALDQPEVKIKDIFVSSNSLRIIADLAFLSNSTVAECGFLIHTDYNVSFTNYLIKFSVGNKTQTGDFEATINDLNINSYYYVCAYAKTSSGITLSVIQKIKTTVEESQIPQGEGTEASPYLISNWKELYWLSQNSSRWTNYYKQTADIDLTKTTTSIKTWSNGQGWTPIGPFSGSYDGNGYIINGLYCYRINSDYQALFSTVSPGGIIKNLGLLDVFVRGDEYIASLIGHNYGKVYNCFAIGNVEANEYAGGLIGYVESTGIVNDCFARVELTRYPWAVKSVAGFVGYNYRGIISRCYSTGKVNSISPISTNKGFVGGVTIGGNFSMKDNFWDTQSSYQIETGGSFAYGENTSDMKTQTTFSGWDFTGVWGIHPEKNNGYPFLQNITSIEFNKPRIVINDILVSSGSIRAIGNLTTLGNDTVVESGFLIHSDKDISLSNYLAKLGSESIKKIGQIEENFSNLLPNTHFYVCAYARNKNGTYYSAISEVTTLANESEIPKGEGSDLLPYFISNWKELNWLSQTPSKWHKVFVQTADIDFSLAVPKIETWDNGAGWSPIGNTTRAFNGNYNGGGFVIKGVYCNRPEVDYQAFFGYVTNGTIKKIGVIDSYFKGNNYVSILVGYNQGNFSSCFASGEIVANNYAGGVVGYNSISGKIYDSFARVNVIRTSGTNLYFGGFGGFNNQGVTTGCYSTNSVVYSGDVNPTNKGFIGGVTSGGNFSMKNNYWDIDNSLQTETGGAYATGKTTSEMKTQATFIGWDFSTTWAIDSDLNNGYPILNTQLFKSTIVLKNKYVSSNSVRITAYLSNLGKAASVECGFLLHTDAVINLTNYSQKISLGLINNYNEFEATLSGLVPNTNYYVVAYAKNDYETSYSAIVQIKTSQIVSQIPSGDGTYTNPFLISNWQELYWLSQNPNYWDKYYEQIADIDLSIAEPSIKTWDNGGGWTPIGNTITNFSGCYNGGGYVISGLYCNRPKSDYQGLFGYTSSKSSIKNLGINDAYIYGQLFVASAFAYNNGTVRNCFAKGIVEGINNLGGFVGYQDSYGRIFDCFSMGSVNRTIGTVSYLGGFVGRNYQGIISRCYSTSKVSYNDIAYPSVKGFVGDVNTGGNFLMTDNYWDISTSGQLSSFGEYALGKTTEEMKKQSTFTTWDFAGIWSISSRFNGGYPYFKGVLSPTFQKAEIIINDYYVTINSINITGELVSIGGASIAECGFLLNTDPDISLSSNTLNLNKGDISQIGNITATIPDLNPNTKYYFRAYAINQFGISYSPVIAINTAEQQVVLPQGKGTEVAPYLISKWQELLWISQNPNQWSKNYLQIADIDLGLSQPTIALWNSGNGWNPIGNTENLFSGVYDGGGYRIIGLYINRSESDYIGLFGCSTSTGIIRNVGLCDVNITGKSNVGSLIGYNMGETSFCYSTGQVNGYYNTGGLIGYTFATGNTSNCYSRTNVIRRTGSYTNFGGFVGRVYQCKLINCYSTGKVEYYGSTSPTNKGFVGDVYTGGNFSMSGNYWDTQTSLQSATGYSYAIGKTTLQMKTQSTFSLWDFVDIWGQHTAINDNYPTLQVDNRFQNSELYPEVSIDPVLVFSGNVCKLSGNIESLGSSSSIVKSGFLIHIYQNIDINQNNFTFKVDIGNSNTLGLISGICSNLSTNTTYYVSAYVTNEFGTSYSSVVQFKTHQLNSLIPQGNGTENAPYLISNWQELYWLSQSPIHWDKQYLQTDDIDLTLANPAITTWNSSSGWSSIGNNTTKFSGTYNGDGYIVNGLYLKNSIDYNGLFGYTSSTGIIKNLGVQNVNIESANYVGALIGYNLGEISNCYSTGIVNAYNYAGGFIGYQGNTGIVTNCFSRTMVNRRSASSSTSLGGFVGAVNQGAVSKCYSTGRVVFLGTTSPTNRGFVGNVTTGGTFTMSDNYWDMTTSGQTSSSYATGKNTADMKIQSTFTNWDFNNTWGQHYIVNDNYPALLLIRITNTQLKYGKISCTPYQISSGKVSVKGTLESLGCTSNSASCGFLVHTSSTISLEAGSFTQKLDLGNFNSPASITGVIGNLNQNTKYYLAAYVTNEFGTYITPPVLFNTTEQPSDFPQGEGTDAAPYLISNWQELYWISKNPSSWNKSFRQTADIDLAQIIPAISTWANGTGWTPVGNNTTKFSGKYNGDGYVINGLFCKLSNSYYVGLFGYTSSTSEIRNLGVSNVLLEGYAGVGGFVGFSSGLISECFSSGKITGRIDLGGFVGVADKTNIILNSYSMTDVIFQQSWSYGYAGFVGEIKEGIISNCYSTGNLGTNNGESLTNRGFLGYLNTNGTLTDNYWDIETSKQTSTGGAYAIGKTTSEMKTQTTFVNWDFSGIWTINPDYNSGYPSFKKTIQNSSFFKRPLVEISSIDLTSSSIECFGDLKGKGASVVTDYGFVINTLDVVNLDPENNVGEVHLGQTTTMGAFSSIINNLSKNTTYYISAFATNSQGTYYSRPIKINTYPIDPKTPSGSGNSVSDPYIISNLSELFWFNIMVNEKGNDFAGKFLKQVNDINASTLNQWRWNFLEGNGWMPVGRGISEAYFQGNYDGTGKSISHVKINYLDIAIERLSTAVQDTLLSVGFFSIIGLNSFVHDVHIEDIVISMPNDSISNTNLSALFAGVNQGTIRKCTVSGSNTGCMHVSGFVYENRGEINQCSAEGVLNSKCDTRTSSFCYINKGTISSSKTNFSFLGYAYFADFCENNPGSIINCYSLNKVNSSSFFAVSNSTGVIKNCYSLCTGNFLGGVASTNFWDTQVSGKTSGSGATGKTTAEMKTASTFLNAGWDFLGETANGTDDIWVIHPAYNNGYPFLVWEAPNLTYLGGTVYYDRDKSNSQNNGDYPIVGMKVELLPEGTITETIHDGSFAFFAEPGDHTYRVIPASPYYQGGDALERSVTIKFLEDTVCSPIGVYGTDVFGFSLNTATVWSRCGRTAPVWAVIQNKGNVPASVEYQFKADSHVTVTGSVPAATSTGTGGEKVFLLNNMQPSEQRKVEIQTQLPVAFTDTVYHNSQLKYNNSVIATNTLKNLIRCSYDPNDISVFPQGLTDKGYVPMDQELTYLIRFQNTGNDTAFVVDVRTMLDEDLDPLSFKFLAASHEMRYFLERDGALRFFFDDINLLDSTSNEPASHGFVLFSIKPKSGIVSGTVANAQAYIYFDYNPPVKTNTTISTFVEADEIISQNLVLNQGWNLVSFYVHPLDSTISGIIKDFASDVEMIKTADQFYLGSQEVWLNSLKYIGGGQAFLIKLKSPKTITVAGTPIFTPFMNHFKKGWNMIGCPLQTGRNLVDQLQGTSSNLVKDFEGFWIPTDPTSSLIKFEPGKGYYIYFDQETNLEW